jgi:hypothetical protein
MATFDELREQAELEIRGQGRSLAPDDIDFVEQAADLLAALQLWAEAQDRWFRTSAWVAAFPLVLNHSRCVDDHHRLPALIAANSVLALATSRHILAASSA